MFGNEAEKQMTGGFKITHTFGDYSTPNPRGDYLKDTVGFHEYGSLVQWGSYFDNIGDALESKVGRNIERSINKTLNPNVIRNYATK